MEASKVTTEYQATIPLKVRKLPGIRQGDVPALVHGTPRRGMRLSEPVLEFQTMLAFE